MKGGGLMNKNVVFFNDGKEVGKNIFRKQILKLGDYVHPNNPENIMSITKETVKKMIENFKAGVIDKVPVPVTHTDSPTANTGYVIGLEEADDGLDAILKIEDDDVAEKIRKGLIPAISASFSFDYLKKDSGERVGPTLLHTALVDIPYLKGMRDFEPIALSDGQKNYMFYKEDTKMDKKMNLEELLKVLKDEHKIDVVALQDEVKTLKESKEKADKDLETATATLSEIGKVLGEVVELSDEGMVASVKKVIGEKTNQEKSILTLSDKIEKMEKEITKRDAKDAVASIVREGKLLPTQAEEFEALYLADKTLFEKITGKLSKVVDLGEEGFNLPKDPKKDIDYDAKAEEIFKDFIGK